MSRTGGFVYSGPCGLYTTDGVNSFPTSEDDVVVLGNFTFEIGRERVMASVYNYMCGGYTKGDRVRIKEGYEHAGEVGEYVGKSIRHAELVTVLFEEDYFWKQDMDGATEINVAAIEPYPYTREERIERAIEDFYDAALFRAAYEDTADGRNLLYAILDAGV
jgi:hypothetical protein